MATRTCEMTITDEDEGIEYDISVRYCFSKGSRAYYDRNYGWQPAEPATIEIDKVFCDSYTRDGEQPHKVIQLSDSTCIGADIENRFEQEIIDRLSNRLNDEYDYDNEARAEARAERLRLMRENV